MNAELGFQVSSGDLSRPQHSEPLQKAHSYLGQEQEQLGGTFC